MSLWSLLSWLMIGGVYNPLFWLVSIPVLAKGDYDHAREWDKKMCICGHNYREHEDQQDKKRPVNACKIEECDCRDFTETRMEKERN